jgi:hypothetical protein
LEGVDRRLETLLRFDLVILSAFLDRQPSYESGEAATELLPRVALVRKGA